MPDGDSGSQAGVQVVQQKKMKVAQDFRVSRFFRQFVVLQNLSVVHDSLVRTPAHLSRCRGYGKDAGVKIHKVSGTTPSQDINPTESCVSPLSNGIHHVSYPCCFLRRHRD